MEQINEFLNAYAVLLISALPVILLLACGIAIKHYKAYWLISGYNTMSAEKKKNVDIKNLGELMANFCYVMSGIIMLGTLLMVLNQNAAGGTVLFLMLPAIIYLLIKAQKYDRNTRESDGTMKTRAKILIGAVIGFLVITFAGIGVMLYSGSKSPEYIVQNGTLKIHSIYGEELKLSEIVSITLQDQIPDILFKNNGFDLGSIKRGYFKLKDIGQVKLFADTNNPPYVFIDGKFGLRIVNTDTPENTKRLYENLLDAWKQS